ncbi:hypothetical protein MLD38_031106 [Melastoma candidum]|uniref:Uncharacterized protein n=1 Tax=Melastoma candidum TaxID=119954 RepID=A0ACB9MNI8_9MYRT|nr:hypothetical protein MLD38_031106 [Melastoma candidum]
MRSQPIIIHPPLPASWPIDFHIIKHDKNNKEHHKESSPNHSCTLVTAHASILANYSSSWHIKPRHPDDKIHANSILKDSRWQPATWFDLGNSGLSTPVGENP